MSLNLVYVLKLFCSVTRDIDNTAKHRVVCSSGLTLDKVGCMTDICYLTRLLDAIGYFYKLCSEVKRQSLYNSSQVIRTINIDLNVYSQFFNWSAKAHSPARSVAFKGGPSVNLGAYFDAIVNGCPNRSSNHFFAFWKPTDGCMTTQHLIVLFASPDVY